MRRWINTLVLGILSALFAVSMASASVSVIADGSDGKSARIKIWSAIRKGDFPAFQAALDRVSATTAAAIDGVPFITVELDSPGGDVIEALKIGQAIDAHSAMTLVRPGHECVSACVFILAAGSVRTSGPGAQVGVHRPMLVAWHHINHAEARAKFDALMVYLRTYLTDLGVSGEAYDIMMRTASSDMRYFSGAELDSFRVRGESPAWLKPYESVGAPLNAPMLAATAPGKLRNLRPLDESYRDVVYMPGDMPTADYLASIGIQVPKFVWTTIDDGSEILTSAPRDIAGWAIGLWRRAEAILAVYWWLVALLLVELYRGRLVPWPKGPDVENALHLGPLRPHRR